MWSIVKKVWAVLIWLVLPEKTWLASKKTIRARLKKRNTEPYGPPKDFLKYNVSTPQRLKHNGGHGGEWARVYMIDRWKTF